MDLKLVNVVNALQNLTLDQTKNLALQLGVELNVLIDIESEQRGETRRAHYIQAWLDIDTEASWEKIIAALNQIGMKVVAAHVTSQYLPKSQESIPSGQSSDPTTSVPVPVDAPVTATLSDSTHPHAKSGAVQLPVSTIESPPDNAPQPISSVVGLEKVAQGKAIIEHLKDSFSDVMSDTYVQLRDESQMPCLLHTA